MLRHVTLRYVRVENMHYSEAKKEKNNKTSTDSNDTNCRLVSNMMADHLWNRNNLATLENINHQPEFEKLLYLLL